MRLPAMSQRMARRIRRYGAALVALSVGIALSFALLGYLRWQERDTLQGHFNVAASERVDTIRMEIDRHALILHSLATFLDGRDRMSVEEFNRSATHLLSECRCLQAFEWAPRVTDRQRETFETSCNYEGCRRCEIVERNGHGQMVRAARRDEYFPVTHIVPDEGHARARKFDLASTEVRRKALDRARDLGDAAMTGQITLAQGDGDQVGCLLVFPVYRKDMLTVSIPQRREALAGFVVGAFQFNDVVDCALKRLRPFGIDIHLYDRSAPVGKQHLYGHLSRTHPSAGPRSPPQRDDATEMMAYAELYDVGGRTWEIVCTASPGLIAANTTWLPFGGLAAGLVCTGLLTVYLGSLTRQSTRRGRLLARVSRTNKRLEKEVAERRETENRIRSIARFPSENPDPVLRVSRSGEILYANDAGGRVLQTLSADVGQHVGQAWLDRLFDAQQSTARKEIDLEQDGQRFVLSITPVEGEDYANIYARDVTEKKQAEEELRNRAHINQMLLDSLPCVALLLRPITREIVACSQAALDAGAEVGKTCWATWRKLEQPCPWCLAPDLWATGDPQHRELEASDVVWDAHWVPVSEELYLYYAFDITERRQMERHVRQSGKMEAVGKLAGGIAHDYRNQLAVIQGFGEMLDRRSLVNEEGRDKLQEILGAAERSTKLVAQLLTFSRESSLNPRVVRLKNVVSELNQILPSILGEHIRVSTTSGDAPAARVDPIALEQAMMNLVINARDAMPFGGDLTIATDCAEVDAQIAARYEGISAGRHAMLTISDTGVGMDETTRSHVFDPYFTTKGPGEGTGLGLAMVYGFVTQSGGFIDCQSRPGEGSVFRLYFPAAAEAVDAPPAAKTIGTVLGGSETILVVEDDEPVRQVLVESLREAGYRVLETANAAEALPLGEYYEGRIDMLVTDVIMPGKDGVALADRVRRIRPKIAVLYVTGYGGKELARHGLPDKDTHLLIKPFRHEELLIRVRQALEAPQYQSVDPNPESRVSTKYDADGGG
ncbi:hypothetical protein LCGC14_0094440 [marine sediment metagenome]|uniref:Uncharacterized protein n=1 Tax=marine sediment metagenome TaxID=412755 RepID=A0A0F9YGJ7_9ZZZZ|nr:response regulator [Phycisphaerae bacterium]HDZ45223.1 response regulator [Phycisphaerae bacterium]